MAYDLAHMKAPRAAGALLKTLVALIENGATGSLLSHKLLADAGIIGLRERPAHHPPDVQNPLLSHTEPAADPAGAPPDLAALATALSDSSPRGHVPESAADFVAAYREGRSDPEQVAERALAIVAESEERSPAMRVLIAQERDDLREQARASADRYARGRPLGPLDGVPVAVKDELDQRGYPTTVGTRFLGTSPADADAEVVARLRAQGALLLGKANMHEIGLGVTGLNPHHGPARNPYDPRRATGGSSSGPAAAVAMGLCPIAVGADGGGSIRIPAALCGQLGLKPTFGRVSEHGAAELCWSVAHVGPIAASARDLALAYAVMAGPDPKDPGSHHQPRVRLDRAGAADLGGLRLGVYREWFEDAETAVVARCRDALALLGQAGAEIVAVDIPELEVMRLSHLVTIVTEMAAAHAGHYARHRREYGHDTRLNLVLGRRLQGYDYVNAQRHRARVVRHFARALAEVDMIVTPATGRTAPPLPDDALETGESNLEVVGQIMRFAPAANLTGLPAVTVPVGYDERSLPIGLQLMGHPWQEDRLLGVAGRLEAMVTRVAPRVCYRYLSE